MTISVPKLKIGLISDVHFFHRRTHSWRMLQAIRRYLPDDDRTAELDILAVTGDWFDHLLSLNDPDCYVAQTAVVYILKLCKKYNILLIVLEGTKSHDRNQNIMFDELNRMLNIGCNIRYRDTLSIDYIPEFGINVLYLPDEWTHNADLTLQQAKDLMRSRGLSKVDFAFTHGAFTYQLNGIPSPALHDPVEWSNLVEYQVFSGHIHTHSRYLNIMSVGSLERLGHNEEEPKGIVIMTYLDGKEAKCERVINELAKVYRTLNVQGMGINDIIQIIDSEGPWEKGSAIRLEFNPTDPILPIMETVKTIWPDLEFTEIKRGKKVKESHRGTAFVQQKFTVTPITRSNTIPLLRQWFEGKKIPEESIQLSLGLIPDLMN